MTASNKRVALLIGATGVTGTPAAEELLRGGWKLYAVSRRAPRLSADTPTQNLHHLAFDLTDAAATRTALSRYPDITHIYYCGNDPRSPVRLAMITHVLDAVEAASPHFANLHVLQGMKYYGVHLGNMRVPARETDPRVPGCDFYYSEEDLVVARQRGKTWTWTALRPHSVCGYAAGNPMNVASVLGIYGSMLKELGEPFIFPASAACFDKQFHCVDAGFLARAAMHISTTPGCGNNAYNISNGTTFTWQSLWPALAANFGLAPRGSAGYSLSEFLADKQPLWNTMTAKYGLVPFPFERASRWAQGDYTAPNSRFACEYDNVSDTAKLRATGFAETVDNQSMFLQLFNRCRAEKLLP
jgi:nucleoside-diphosphate-sugar epimerase